MSDILVSARGLGKSYPQVFRPRDRLRALWRLLTARAMSTQLPCCATSTSKCVAASRSA